MQGQTVLSPQPSVITKPRRSSILLGACWLSLLTLLWVLPPWLLCQARMVGGLAVLGGLLALAGWCIPWQPLVMWSGIVGLGNFTLALLITGAPPNAWLGLMSGCTLFALLDGSQHFAYLRYCQVEPAVLIVLLRAVVRLSGLTLLTGLAFALFLPALPLPLTHVSAAIWFTIGGAAMFVGFLALFLFQTSRWTGPSS